MNENSLGVLITSEKNGVHLYPLFRAAKRKNIALAIHLQGDGVRLCLDKKCQKVLGQIQFTICQHSAEAQGVADQIRSRYPQALASDLPSPVAIGECAKHMVL